MTLDPLAGHVVVLAGTEAATGIDLMSRGALLAAVSDAPDVIDELERAALDHPTTVLLSYRADPSDPAVWQRIAPHIEQRVGPVDAVLCAESSLEAAKATFATDMRRRGHGVILAISSGQDVVADLPHLLRRTP